MNLMLACNLLPSVGIELCIISKSGYNLFGNNTNTFINE